MRRERVRIELLERTPFNVVFHAELSLVRNDFLFGTHLRLAEHQVRHAVRFELDEQRKRALGCVLVVVRPVGPRRGIGFRTRAFHQSVELAVLVVLRFVEHQVLEQVREPGLAGAFVS